MQSRSALLLMTLLSAGSAVPMLAQLASMVTDIRTIGGSGDSSPVFLGSAAATTYFTATAPSLGRELWSTEGTPESTRLVADNCPGPCESHYTVLGETADRLYLARSEQPFLGTATALLIASGNPSVLVTVVVDVDSGTLSLSGLTEMGATAMLDGDLLFSAITAPNVVELYVTDGAAGSYHLLARFESTNGLQDLQRAGDRVFFWNQPAGAAIELWETDGTAGGTRQIAVPALNYPTGVSVGLDDGSLVFVASDENGIEVWGSDGSSLGTRRISNFADSGAKIWQMKATGNRAFFYVEDVTFGQEMWTSDGTPEGTHALTSFGYFEPFGDYYSTQQLVVAGDRAFFPATNGIDGMQLWVTAESGTTASPLLGVCPYLDCFYEYWIYAVGSQVFFLNSDTEHGTEVWTSDGRLSGTHLLHDACPGTCTGSGSVLASSTGRLVYSGSSSDPYTPTVFVATAPWTTALSLFDAVRGAPLLDLYGNVSGADDGSHIYVSARDPFSSLEPWVSSGSAASTLQLAEIYGPQDTGSFPRGFAANDGTVAFMADDDHYDDPPFWLTEGTAASTRLADAADGVCAQSSLPIQSLGSRFVTAGCGGQILVIDPGTNQVAAISTGDCWNAIDLGVVDQTMAALLQCESSTQIWRSDGTVAGTARALTFADSFYVNSPLSLVNGRLLLAGGSTSSRLYALSATMSSLLPLTEPGVHPESVIAPEGEPLAFFSQGTRVWRTDGTPAGTFAIGPANEWPVLKGAVASPAGYDLLVKNELSFFEVWTTDGTSAGTHVRSVVGPSNDSNWTVPLDRAENLLYFVISTQGVGTGLWVLPDGSTEPQRLLANVPGSYVDNRSLVHRGGREYFSACDSNHGCELWTSDGTEAGTRLLHDISPGAASSNPYELLVVGTTLYFGADDGQHGFELWTVPLDGGPACRANDLTLCLEGERFQVSARWTDFAGRSGDATAVPITGDTGYFWFFDDANVELILKLIDGTGYNGHHWVYYGALSNVEYTFTVTDSETGAAKRYFNPATRFASSGDITAFGPQGAHAQGGPAEAMTRAATPPEMTLATLAALSAPEGLPGACVPTATRFCILNNRFAVTATWRDFAGNTGTANTGNLTDDTGYFWFFDEANVEVVLKMVDAGAFNGHFWVYYGALSNVEYTLTVTDTVAGGPSKIYRNALGQFGSFGDIGAFPAP